MVSSTFALCQNNNFFKNKAHEMCYCSIKWFYFCGVEHSLKISVHTLQSMHIASLLGYWTVPIMWTLPFCYECKIHKCLRNLSPRVSCETHTVPLAGKCQDSSTLAMMTLRCVPGRQFLTTVRQSPESLRDRIERTHWGCKRSLWNIAQALGFPFSLTTLKTKMIFYSLEWTMSKEEL